jgi:para-aminobenzoate synthetase/4-amino-4-deoxychorismate lyase
MKDVFLLFEDTKESPETAILFRSPIAEIKAQSLDEVKDCLAQMDAWRRKGCFVAGALAYEAGYAFLDKRPREIKQPRIPFLHFYVFKTQEKVGFNQIPEFQEKSSKVPPNELAAEVASRSFIYNVSESLDFSKYSKVIEKLKNYFVQGDSYQTNFSLRQSFKTPLNPFEFYKSLRPLQKVSYAAFLHFPEGNMLSFSPELFFKKQKAQLLTKPMKGTTPRSSNPKKDEANKLFLKNDEKTLAENLMIVDLLRNDLGKLAEPGTVEVENLFEVQSFETLHQMITTVRAQVDPDISIGKVLEGLFPCGSITGAPKVRTMEIIAELEDQPRGIYTGAIGFITPENDFSFSVAIRTLMETAAHTYELGLGGGVLIDSQAEAEYKECLLKGQFVKRINEGFSIFETFLFDGEKCRNLEAHLERQEKSCRFFGFPFDKAEARERLSLFLKGAPNKPVKLKLSANVNGSLALDAASVGLESKIPLTVSISEHRTQSTDVFFQNKTSHRHLYDNEGRISARDNQYDILFFNEKGELTEASRHNVFLNIKGQWYTPPVSCGLLPGVQRALTIGVLGAQEKILTREDLFSAEKIILTNSVRGLVEVKLRELP